MTGTRERISRRAAVFALAVVATVGLAATPVDAGGGDNVVLALNSADESHLPRSGVAVTRASGDVVDNENLAYAKSSCHGCRTGAVAVQAVLIMSDASVITPKNAAVAVNEGCSSCETMAAAYQYVLTTGEPVHLTAAGEQEVATLRRQIADVAASGLPFLELEAKLDQLFERFKGVIDDEVVRAGGTPAGTVDRLVWTDAA
jgi:hypothetical protein